MTPFYRRPALAACLLAVAAGHAAAQPIYRSTDASGRPVFTDQPPSASARSLPDAAPAPAAGSGLPYELRQVAQRYPVTLYSSDDCAPCSTGRSLLITRGVPFQERTIKTQQDVSALRRLSGQEGLPLLAIGAQQLKGFSDAEWSQYLDAAGYPKSNQLPDGYANPPAQPLVAVQEAAPAPASNAAPAAAPPPSPAQAGGSGPTPDNPAGIRF